MRQFRSKVVRLFLGGGFSFRGGSGGRGGLAARARGTLAAVSSSISATVAASISTTVSAAIPVAVVAAGAAVIVRAVPGVALLARLNRLGLDGIHLVLVQVVGPSDHHAQDRLAEVDV